MMDFAQMRKFMELDIIEIIPLAFMRGRTLNEAVIICDEAQNTSGLQMLMVLTRLGHGSKMIITGDITQVDLADNQKSGMVEAMEILEHDQRHRRGGVEPAGYRAASPGPGHRGGLRVRQEARSRSGRTRTIVMAFEQIHAGPIGLQVSGAVFCRVGWYGVA